MKRNCPQLEENKDCEILFLLYCNESRRERLLFKEKTQERNTGKKRKIFR